MEMLDLNLTLDLMDLADIYIPFHPTFFPSAQGTVSKRFYNRYTQLLANLR